MTCLVVDASSLSRKHWHRAVRSMLSFWAVPESLTCLSRGLGSGELRTEVDFGDGGIGAGGVCPEAICRESA